MNVISFRKTMPITYLLFTLITSVIFHLVIPVKVLLDFPYNLTGLIFLIIGICINVQTDNLFRKNETSVKPEGKSSVLIISGSFKYSRNPMYLGMLLITLGVSLLLGSISSFLPSLLFYLVLEYIFIRYEEKKLEKTFGQEYIKYKKKVRRWI